MCVFRCAISTAEMVHHNEPIVLMLKPVKSPSVTKCGDTTSDGRFDFFFLAA